MLVTDAAAVSREMFVNPPASIRLIRDMKSESLKAELKAANLRAESTRCIRATVMQASQRPVYSVAEMKGHCWSCWLPAAISEVKISCGRPVSAAMAEYDVTFGCAQPFFLKNCRKCSSQHGGCHKDDT